MHLQQLKGMQSSKQGVKGVPFVNRRYTKGEKLVYKRVRGWTSGRSLPVQKFVEKKLLLLSK